MSKYGSVFDKALSSLYSETNIRMFQILAEHKEGADHFDLYKKHQNKFKKPSNMKIKLENLRKDGLIEKVGDRYSNNTISTILLKYSQDPTIKKLERRVIKNSSHLPEKILLYTMSNGPQDRYQLKLRFELDDRIIRRVIRKLKDVGFMRDYKEFSRYIKKERDSEKGELTRVSEKKVYELVSGSPSGTVRIKNVKNKMTMYEFEKGSEFLLEKGIISDHKNSKLFGLTASGKTAANILKKIQDASKEQEPEKTREDEKNVWKLVFKNMASKN